MNQNKGLAIIFFGANVFEHSYRSKVTSQTVKVIKNSLIKLSEREHFFDLHNNNFHRPSDLYSAISFIEKRYQTIIIYFLGIIRLDIDHNIYLAHQHSTPGRLSTHISFNRVFDTINSNVITTLFIIDSISEYQPLMKIPIKSNFICYFRRLQTGRLTHNNGADKLSGVFAETLLKFINYIPQFTLNDLIIFIGHSLDEYTYSPNSLYKIIGDLFINKYKIKPNNPSEYRVWSVDPNNFGSENKGSREDGIQNLHFLSQNIKDREEANFIANYFLRTDENEDVRLAAYNFIHNINKIKIQKQDFNTSELIRVVDFNFITIPEGPFLMGTSLEDDRFGLRNETPQHEQYLEEFKISADLITNYIYNIYLRSIQNQEITDEKHLEPVSYVSWYEAIDFCNWLTYQLRTLRRLSLEEYVTLPSEPEWEKAARGLDKRVYPWGKDFDKTKCNCRESGVGKKMPVGSYSPEGDSFYGVRDMSGNVWEWTRSLWGRNGNKPTYEYPYYADDGRENLQASSDIRRVIRGGAYYYFDYCVRISTRNVMFPITEHSGGGFRIVIKSHHPKKRLYTQDK